MSVTQQSIRPPEPPGPIAWMRKNLFSNWYNGLLTILSVIIIYWFFYTVIRWIFQYADWRPVVEYPLLFMVGQYPREYLWRIGLSLAVLTFLMGLSWGVWRGLIESFAITIGALLALAAVMPIQMNEEFSK